jgi:hypothetical protein
MFQCKVPTRGARPSPNKGLDAAESRGPYFGKALSKGVTRQKDQNRVLKIGSSELH